MHSPTAATATDGGSWAVSNDSTRNWPRGTRRAMRDHGLRDIDTQNVVPGVGGRVRQGAASAAQVDHETALDAAPGKRIDQDRGRRLCKAAKARVVDVRQVVAVGVGHRLRTERRNYLS